MAVLLPVVRPPSGPVEKKKKLPQRLPKPVTAGRITAFTDLELNFDVYDEVRTSGNFLADFGAYSNWVSDLLYREHHLRRAICGGEIHLRLFFSYLNTFNALRILIAKNKHWFDFQCSEISLILYSGGNGIPNQVSLSRGRVLAGRSRRRRFGLFVLRLFELAQALVRASFAQSLVLIHGPKVEAAK